MPRSISIFLLFTVAVGLADCHASDVSSLALPCAGAKFTYLLFIPDRTQPLPAILLLHGAGDQASDFLGAWKSFAKKQKIVLIAPELPRDPKFEDMAPEVFRCMVDDAKKRSAIDPDRVYVFGNSMGGYLAYDAAMFDSEYFAAVAVHAMGIADEYAGILKHAKRKTPIAIYIGDQDPLVPVAKVRATRDLLEKAGFPVQYVEVKGHDHNFYALTNQVTEAAWKFLSVQRLSSP
jgi:dipeptidyl aminopeptidase/acylaminoacyl peptidase